MATLIKEPTATPSQEERGVYFTSGSTITIERDAKKVFSVILDTSTYEHWNTTNPHVTFGPSSSEQVLWAPEGRANLSFLMTPSSKPIQVPVRILTVHQDDTVGSYRIEWQGEMLPQWFGLAERVQTVRSLGPDQCELVQWESMSGWGVRIMDWIFGTRKQMDAVNVKYAEDLKGFVESSG